jgi:hypothetical protein
MNSSPKTIFDWLEEITFKKTPISNIEDESWNNFNSFMTHRFVSMNQDYIELANFLQTFPPQDKKQLYSVYKELIPKKKLWLKYIKNQNKLNIDLLKILAKYFECSIKEVNEYMINLSKDEILDILRRMGYDEKEIKKLKI